jgi:DNA-binding response OmpR family regulator
MTTLLVLEDDDATRTFLADNLLADGFEMLVADCAQDALRLLEAHSPDLAIIDVGLPDGSGLDVVQRVRLADERTARIDPATPMIVVSGRSNELDRLRGLRRGADDFVSKPFSYPELLAGVDQP